MKGVHIVILYRTLQAAASQLQIILSRSFLCVCDVGEMVYSSISCQQCAESTHMALPCLAGLVQQPA